jgi:UDP-N-acetyl-D-mannosaminuronic acid transferase (WecB/TagA/CpsF family)
MNIFGIGIDNLSRAEALSQIDHWLAGGDTFHRIATVNPEFLLLAERNAAFRGALLSADLRLADGSGLYLPFFLAGESSSNAYRVRISCPRYSSVRTNAFFRSASSSLPMD